MLHCAVFAAWLRQLHVGRCDAANLAGHLERARVSGIPQGSAVRQAVRGLRQLRTALEPVSDLTRESDAPRPDVPSPCRFSAVIPCLDEEAAIAQVVSARACAERERRCRRGWRLAGQNGRTRRPAPAPASSSSHDAATGVRSRRASPQCVRTRTSWSFSTATAAIPWNSYPDLVSPIIAGQAVFVLGSRVRGARERGSLTPQQVIAAYVGRLLLRLVYGARFTDLSPFRAIRRDVLDRLGMVDMTYGWNLEMLMRVAAADLPALEIAVGQRCRIGGVSKVSGNIIAGVKAACPWR